MASGGILSKLNHPIVEQSFAIIEQEMGEHNLSPAEYAIALRVIHTTADFELAKLLYFSPDAITSGIAALRQGKPIVTDVTMVKQGIMTMVAKTYQNPVIAAIEQASIPLPGKTRTETGILDCLQNYPEAIYVIGNAPTALLAISQEISQTETQPSLVIGAPVGFVKVVEAKQALAQTSIPQIRIEGRKGGSPVAAAILNALLVLAWEE